MGERELNFNADQWAAMPGTLDIHSIYAFNIVGPETLYVGKDFTTASVTLYAFNAKEVGYDKVLIKVDVQGPEGANITIMANDGNQDWNLAEIGQWGPSTGFAISKDYTATTPLTHLIFDKPGTYTATFQLVDLNNNNVVLASSTHTITVSYGPADYTAVDAALAKIPADLSKYTSTTVEILNAAKNAVIRDLTEDHQAEVDQFARNIEAAITGLELRNISSGSSGSSGSSSYNVTVSSGIKHGTITVSPKSASKGTTVTITIKPNKGYELDDLTVTDKNGDTVKLTKKNDNQYTFKMPASKVTIDANFVGVKEVPTYSFEDVPNGYWAEDAIAWAFEKGYMNGTSETTFNPGGNVSRQQLWMILARVSGENPANMAEAKIWTMANGISDGTAPGGSVTRQQMVAILYRYATLMGLNVPGKADLSVYPDAGSVAGYAKDAMSWAVANGIVSGTTQGTLNPTGTASRAQFAVILNRFCEKMM